MPQPAEVDRAARDLADLYRSAQQELEQQLAGLIGYRSAAARRRRLRDLDRSLTATLDRLDADSRAWLQARFPDVYRTGARDAAVQLGERFEWTDAHFAAVQALVDRTWDDILAATTYVRDSAKRWVRDQARRQTGLSLLEGRTAQQAARAFVSEAGEVVDALGGPVGMVRYADGSYRRLADYADMLLRTTTATAFNAGSLNVMTQHGVGWVEVIDGADCGWSHHDDPDRANGSIRPVAEAYAVPLSHPRCRRSFAARPDVRTATAAGRAGTIRSEASIADQAQAEAARAELFTRRRATRQRRERNRQPRQPRNATASGVNGSRR